MFVADTTFLIDLVAADPGASKVVEDLDAVEELLATTFVNAYEFLVGNATRSSGEQERGRSLLDHLLVLDGDFASALLSAEAGRLLVERGQRLPLADLLIAGIVIRAGGTLLTRDEDFARVPGLAVRSY